MTQEGVCVTQKDPAGVRAAPEAFAPWRCRPVRRCPKSSLRRVSEEFVLSGRCPEAFFFFGLRVGQQRTSARAHTHHTQMATPFLCIAGAAVAAGLTMSRSRKAGEIAQQSACSARKATVEEDSNPAGAPGTEDTLEPLEPLEPGQQPATAAAATAYDDGLWGFSEEAKEQFRDVKAPSHQKTAKVKQALSDLTSNVVEATHHKEIGVVVPVLGRPMERARLPAVHGACLFNMSESYADAMDAAK